MVYKHIELFAGAGGLALGFERAGFDTILCVDSMKSACQTLKINRPNWNVVCDKIENVDYSSYKNVDVLTGGFPCQPFSVAGLRKGFNDERGRAVFSMMKIIKEIQPKIIVAENVKNIIYIQKGRVLKFIIKYLNLLGYRVTHQVLNAKNYYTPQSRERLFIVATRKDLNITYDFPKPCNDKIYVKDVIENVPHSSLCGMSHNIYQIIKHLPKYNDHHVFAEHLSDVGKELAKNNYPKSLLVKKKYFRRIAYNNFAPTVTTSMSRPLTAMIHPYEDRYLTVREAARLQTFPDDWVFAGSKTQQYTQIGNAVPVNLAYYIALSVKEALDKIDNL